jgi:hypothetical protein
VSIFGSWAAEVVFANAASKITARKMCLEGIKDIFNPIFTQSSLQGIRIPTG